MTFRRGTFRDWPLLGGGFVDPTDISDLALWLDGSDASVLFQTSGTQPWGVGTNQVTVDGQTVASWLDKSGQDNHLNQAGGNNEPTYKTGIQNGLSVLRSIDAVQDDWLYSTASVLTQDQNVTIFWVGASTSDETVGVVFSNTNTNSERLSAYVDTRTALRRGGVLKDSTGTVLPLNGADIGTEFNQLSLVVDTSDITARLNGTGGTPVAKAGDGVTGNDYTRVFNEYSENTKLFGDIGELVVYDRTLTAAEIGQVETYLKDKWATP